MEKFVVVFEWVRKFNPYDLPSKADSRVDVVQPRPYHEELIQEFFPAKIRLVAAAIDSCALPRRGTSEDIERGTGQGTCTPWPCHTWVLPMRGGLLFFLFISCCAAQAYRVETVAGSVQQGFGGERGPAYRAQLNGPAAVALDASGRVYIADAGNNRVRRVEIDSTIVTIAGNGERGHTGDLGPANSAAITVADIVVDPQGTLFIAGGSAVRAVNTEGVIWTIAGHEVGLSAVTSIALENSGTLLVADAGQLRRVARDGAVSEIPLSGIAGAVTAVATAPDGSIYFVAGETIQRRDPAGNVSPVAVEFPVDSSTRLAVDSVGELHVSSGRVWKLAGGRSWVLAGTEIPGFSGDNGPAVLAQVNRPAGLALDAASNVYFADSLNHRVRLLRAPFAGSISAFSPSARAIEIWPRNLALRWTPLVNAEFYEVWFGKDPNALTRVAVTSASSHLLTALENRTTYYWRISTRFLPLPPVSSPVFSFTTTTATDFQAPPLPANPQPHNFAVGLPGSLLLSWSGTGASRYEIYLDTNEYVVQRAGFAEEQRFFVTNLRPNTKYYWRVLAVNDWGQEYSQRWEFTTGPANGYPYLIDTVAGTALPRADGTVATEAVLEAPRHVITGPQGDVLFVEGNRRIRRIDADGKLRTVYTSQIGDIVGLAADSGGNIYVALPEYVLRIPRTGPVAVLAGQPGRRGYSGDRSAATQAMLDGIRGIAVDRRGNVFIADSGNHRVRVVGSNGQIRTYAGTGACAQTETSGTAATTPFCSPGPIATDSEDNLYVSSSGWIFRIRPDENIEAVTTAESVGGIAVDGKGNVLLLDARDMVLRRVLADGNTEHVAGEPDVDGRAFGFFGDGLPAARARFAFPDGLFTDPAGNVLIADAGNNRIRRIDANGFVSTIAGTDSARGDRGPSTGAWLNNPTDVAVNATGDVYIADSGNHRIRRVTPTRFLDTVAGGGTGSVQDVQASSKRVGSNARDIRIDLSLGGVVKTDDRGNVLFTDGRFSWLTPDGTEAIYTMDAGGNLTGYVDSRVRRAGGIARGPSGETYISDTLGHRVLRIDAAGTPTVVAGTGAAGFAGDGGLAVLAQVNAPRALSISPAGELYVAEFGRVRRITSDGRIVTVLNEHANGIAHDRLSTLYLTAGRSVFALSQGGMLRRLAGRESAPSGANDGGLALDTRLADPRGISVSREGEIYFADAGDHVVRRLVLNVPSSIAVLAGDGQTIVPNQPVQALRVRVTGRTGRPVPGVEVTFTRTSATAAPAVIAVQNTNSDGIASASPSTGPLTGEVTFTATITGLAPVTFRVNVAGAPQ